MATSDASLRWKPIIDRVKTRLALKDPSMPRKLNSALDEAVATYDSLLQDMARLETENRAHRSRIRTLQDDWDCLFGRMPVACVMTDRSGVILRGNERAAALVNMSARHLERENKPLIYFTQDREGFLELLKALWTGHDHVRGTLRVRPRERAPLMIDIVAVPRCADDPTLWFWFLTPSATVPASETSMASLTPLRTSSS